MARLSRTALITRNQRATQVRGVSSRSGTLLPDTSACTCDHIFHAAGHPYRQSTSPTPTSPSRATRAAMML